MAKGKMTQKDAVRLALETLGKDAKNAALAAWCNETHGTTLKPNGISILKGQIKKEKKGRGRPPKEQKEARRSEVTETITSIRALIRKLGAAEVKHLVDALK